MRPQPRPLPDRETRALAALLTRRRQLVEMLTAEKNRLASASASIRKSLRAHITWLERELAHTDTELHEAIQRSPVWGRKNSCCAVCPAWGPC
jgi:transposase